jgi:osmoprotectant transport system permease protein
MSPNRSPAGRRQEPTAKSRPQGSGPQADRRRSATISRDELPRSSRKGKLRRELEERASAEPHHHPFGTVGVVLVNPVGLSDSSCLLRNEWVCWEYVQTRGDELRQMTGQHLYITAVSILLAFVVSLPLALLVRRWAPLEGPVLGTSTMLYTIPSLALFALLQPLTGLTIETVIIGITTYSLVILVRTNLTALRSVPADAVEAARGMGYDAGRMLLRVELPLALPTIFAGLRLATVSAVALTTVGAIIGFGGLGNAIYRGYRSNFKAEVLTASVLCVALAIVADLLLIVLQRRLTPWRRTAG